MIARAEDLPLRTDEDVVRLRQATRQATVDAGFSLVEQTKVVTAASELARNTIIYGGGGDVRLEIVTDGMRAGVKLTFVDRGPGIADIAQALRDGYTTGHGLGLGLGGARRLMGQLDIQSRLGEGTTITALRWKA